MKSKISIEHKKREHHEELKKRTKWNHIFLKVEPFLILLFISIVLYILLKDTPYLGYKKYLKELNDDETICFSVLSNFKDLDVNLAEKMLNEATLKDRFVIFLGDFANDNFEDFFNRIEEFERKNSRSTVALLLPGKSELSRGYKPYYKHFGKNNFLFEIYFRRSEKKLLLIGLDNVYHYFQDSSALNLPGKKIIFSYNPILDQRDKCINCNLLDLFKEDIILWITKDHENKRRLISSKVNYMTLNTLKTNQFIGICIDKDFIYLHYIDLSGNSVWFKRLLW